MNKLGRSTCGIAVRKVDALLNQVKKDVKEQRQSTERYEKQRWTFELHTKNMHVKSVEPAIRPPRLATSLEKVLFQPITFQILKDPRTGVYNFDEKLEIIRSRPPPLADGSAFVPPHKDETLLKMATDCKAKYLSSTSSMSSALSQLHHFLSNFKSPNMTSSVLTGQFARPSRRYAKSAYLPATVILRKLVKPGQPLIRSISADSTLDKDMILSALGHTLEDFLIDSETAVAQNTYHYLNIDEFMLRSQLDCFHPQLPGTGVFDLKTRAVVAIRHDLPFIEKNGNYTGYEIDKLYGEFESMEREFHDLVRSTLLKYSFQARIGKMDGIFVAYHNINKMFGFQYLPLEEIDYIIHSNRHPAFQKDLDKREEIWQHICGEEEFVLKHKYKDREIATRMAEQEFQLSIGLLRNILVCVENQMKYTNTKWQECKVMLKAYYNDKLERPVLKVLAIPLEENETELKLSSLVSNDMPPNKILEALEHFRKYNKDLIKARKNKIVGFDVYIDHLYEENSQSTHLPEFAHGKSNVLSNKNRKRVRKVLTREAYVNAKLWKRPHFYHPSDISTWKCNVTMVKIWNSDALEDACNSLLDEKLSYLENECQSLLEDSDREQSEETIAERIVAAMNAMNKEQFKPSKSNFKETLRAYGKRGALNSSYAKKGKII